MAVRLTITVPPGWAIIAGKTQIRAVLRAAGNEVAARAKAMIRAGGATKKRAAKRQSAAGGPPVSRTGDLARGIKVKLRRDGEGVTIKDVAQSKNAAFYALFLEYGAKGGGGDTHNRANILRAGARNWRGKILRSQNRMKASAISKTRVLLPHPFMEPALDQVVANGLADRIREAVMSGLKFQRGAK
jgi:HK97 gp10 family phage protein